VTCVPHPLLLCCRAAAKPAAPKLKFKLKSTALNVQASGDRSSQAVGGLPSGLLQPQGSLASGATGSTGMQQQQQQQVPPWQPQHAPQQSQQQSQSQSQSQSQQLQQHPQHQVQKAPAFKGKLKFSVPRGGKPPAAGDAAAAATAPVQLLSPGRQGSGMLLPPALPDYQVRCVIVGAGVALRSWPDSHVMA
jgi:hypothetical protein